MRAGRIDGFVIQKIMPEQTAQSTAFMDFIKEHRGDERHFEKIYNKLNETILEKDKQTEADYLNSLNEVKEKQAEAYKQAREKTGSAWPEFEKFVTELERAITASIKE
jgi:hypothetical protein